MRHSNSSAWDRATRKVWLSLPEKAIQAREVEAENQRGEKVRILQPYVKFELCVGCGICETKCPLLGPAGVRVVHVKDAAVTPEMAR